MLISGLSLALVIAGSPAIAAEVAPIPPSAAGAEDFVRPDSVSAMVSARSLGQRVEDMSQRDEVSRVFANPDGSWTSETASEPESVRDLVTGEWEPIDTTLVQVDGGWRPRAAAADVLFSDGGDRVFAALSEQGKDLGWKWTGVLPVPVVDGSTATYPNVVENGDLVVTALSTGFTYNIVLRSRPSEPLVFRLPIVTDGAVVSENAQGGLEVETKKGELLSEAPAPVMWDSSENIIDDPKVKPLDTSVGSTVGGEQTVTLSPDAGFLADPATVYPVTIDPTFTTYATGDKWVQNIDYTNVGEELRVGTYDGGTHKARTFVKFNTSDWDGKQILSANLVLRNFHSTTCTSSAIRATRITADWTAASLTWANQPGASITGAADYAPAAGGPTGSACELSADATWGVTSIVQSWANTPSTNFGFRLAALDETANASWRKYRSRNQTTGGPGLVPKVNVTYNSYPNTAGTPTVTTTPSSSTGYSRSATPTLSATVGDPDAGSVRATFYVYQGATLKWTSPTTGYVAAGKVASVVVPSTAGLVNGTAYTVKAMANDGNANAKAYSPSTAFTIDTSAPAVTVTASSFTENSWTGTPPASNTFTLDGPADTAYFSVAKDGVTTSLTADASGNAAVAWNPSNGLHTLKVVPFDKAGNSGSETSFAFGVGDAQLVSPVADQASTAAFGVSANGAANATGARLEYRIADTGAAWATASGVKTSSGSTWAGAVSQVSGASATGDLVWDVRTSAGATTSKAVEVRACFTYTGVADNCSAGRVVQLVESAFGGRFPTSQLGPAEVSLFTGEARISSTDAVDSAAGVGREFASFDGATSVNGAFGYGWSSTLLAESSVASASIVDNKTEQKRFVLQMPGWGEQTYSQSGSTNVYVPEGLDDGSRLTLDAAALLRYTPVNGAEVSWELVDSAWKLKAVDPEGSASAAVIDDSTSTFIAQVAPGTSAACNLTQQQPGCRGLKLTKSTGHITGVTQVVAGQADEPLVAYTYTSNKLDSVCDLTQGTSWCTTYTYTTVNGRTLLASVAPPGGLTPWAFTYDSTGRLLEVRRDLASPAAGQAIWTAKYDLPITTTGIPVITATSAAEWGQDVLPTKAAAVWQPNRVPAITPTSADLAYSQVSWMTAGGVTTNTAVNSGSQWLVDTTWYDSENVVRQLDGAGWARVQAAAVADRPGLAFQASSFTQYNTAGTRVEDQYGPLHTATLKSGTTGQYRQHTRFVYDDQATGITVPTPPNGQTAWNLVIDTVTSASSVDLSADYDATIVRNTYDSVVTGDASGWALGKPTRTAVQLAGGGWSTTVNRYNSEGQLIETRQPGGGADASGAGNDARSTQVVYYTAAANIIWPECGGKPDWAGLECMHGPAAQPAGNPIPRTFTTSYNTDLVALVTEDRSGGSTRTATTTLDTKGRVSTFVQTVTGGNAADPALPTITYTYNTSGQLEATSAGGESTNQTYDAWGRPSTYTDASGMPSTSTYTPAGQLATLSDGVGTYSYTYNDNRGLPTSIDIGLTSGPDVFTFAYDNNGSPTAITYPNGTVGTRTYDELGVPQTLTYGNGTTQFLGFANTTDVAGRIIATESTASAQAFTYDNLNRLTEVEDTRAGACTTRTYGFSATSERTAKTTYAPDATNACQSATPSVSWTGTYDTGNRITNTGYTYDNLGRTRTTPAGDTAPGAMGAITSTYYPNDMVASLSQPVDNGTGTAVTKTNTYSLDPSGRVDAITSTTAGTETQRLKYRFTGTSDAPSSITTSTDAGSTWATTRYIQLPGLGMAGTVNTTTDWQLANLHGDVVATQPNTTGVTTLSSYNETDEYGNTIQGTPGRYGYLGTHQRAADNIGGLTLMGARLYNPTTGNFVSMDPVLGGGATRFGYPTDPINQQDLNGELWGWLSSAFVYGLKLGLTTIAKKFVCLNLGGPICAGIVSAAVAFVSSLVTNVFVRKRSVSSSLPSAITAGAAGFYSGVVGYFVPYKALWQASRNLRTFGGAAASWLRSNGYIVTAAGLINGTGGLANYLMNRYS